MVGETSSTSSGSSRSHAGVEADGLTLVAFDTEAELRSLLDQIGITVDEEGRLIAPDGSVFVCSSCAKEVPVGEVGHVMPGSTHIYCKDPVCILDYLERFG